MELEITGMVERCGESIHTLSKPGEHCSIAWKTGCSCKYRYGGVELESQEFPQRLGRKSNLSEELSLRKVNGAGYKPLDPFVSWL